jgi:hypothetical protein
MLRGRCGIHKRNGPVWWFKPAVGGRNAVRARIRVAAADVSADFSMNRPRRAAVALVKGPGRSGSSCFDSGNRLREMNIFVEPARPDPGRAGSVMRQIHPFCVEGSRRPDFSIAVAFSKMGCRSIDCRVIGGLRQKDKIYSVPQNTLNAATNF